jgi:hypothetical protein
MGFVRKLIELAREVVQLDRERMEDQGAPTVADGGVAGADPRRSSSGSL